MKIGKKIENFGRLFGKELILNFAAMVAAKVIFEFLKAIWLSV